MATTSSRIRKIRPHLASFLKRHWTKLAAALVVLAILFPIAHRTIFKPQRQYETATAQVSTLTQTLEVSGVIHADKIARLHFQTSGQLAWVGVKNGDWVSKSQTIASLDKAILARQLQKELNDYLKSRWNFDQIREDNLVTTDNYDTYSFSNTIERAINQKQFDLNNSVLDVEIQHLTNALAALVSPISGIVTAIDTPVAGVNVSAADTFTIVDPQSLYFEVEVDESDIGQVAIGQEATISLEAFPDQTLESEVTWIDFEAKSSDSGGTVFLVKLKLSPEPATLRLGMTGDATITLAEKTDVLVIPLDAIQEAGSRTFVRILSGGGQITEPDVTLGMETDADAEIISGLEPGTLVITGEKEAQESSFLRH